MENNNFLPFQMNFEDQFKLPKLANLDEINEVQNRKPNREGYFTLPVIYLNEMVIFPGAMTTITLTIGSPVIPVVLNAQESKLTVLGCYTDPHLKEGAEDQYLSIAVELAVGPELQIDAEHLNVLVQARRRLRILDFFLDQGFPMAKVEVVKDKTRKTQVVLALMRAATRSFQRYLELSTSVQEDVLYFAQATDEPGKLADMIASTLEISHEKRLDLFVETDGEERLKMALRQLETEIKLLELESSIQEQVQSEIDDSQREAYLREELTKLQKELNDGRSTDPEIQSIADQLEKTALPPEPKDVALKELDRLKAMPPLSPESGMVQSYLHWLIDLPWSLETEDNLDINHAKSILDQNHHGLQKAKDRVLEYLAVRSLKPKRNRQPILCFVGAPGTGKTSLGRSIASAMERKFVRLSLGGVHDEAEIRGHRRTYLGALPGRILQTMRKAKVTNPLFMLDEIDKLGTDFQGDPAAALLEVLDPEQNYAFSDHYLEVPYDLSKVFFITTANTVNSIPPALLDRMEVIEFPGYIEEEKIAIARQFLIPNQLLENGLDDENIHFLEEALKLLIENYTYEAGVRNLEREIGSVLRKIARLKTEGKVLPQEITQELVQEFLGPVEFFMLSAEDEDQIGTATAVAWTENGGEIMPIEVLVVPGKGNLQITGQIGDVMQESAQAALSYLKSKAELFKIPEDFFEETDVHIHVPEGSIPKDGPSAGITLATALTSAVLGVPIHHELAMTGEITLRGRVLPIGGVREKVLAAHRSGIKKILLPSKNAKDLVDVPESVRKDLDIVFVDHMDEVLSQALNGKLIYSKPQQQPKKKRKDASQSDAPEQELNNLSVNGQS